MKKTIFSLGVIAAAAISLVSCQKEISAPDESPVVKGTPFEIIATSADTKTVNNGLETEWAGNESINLFYAEAGSSTYNNGGEFKTTESGASVKFNGTIDANKLGDSNDWYAFYPYNKDIESPANGSKVKNNYSTLGHTNNGRQTQNGVNNKSHLAGDNLPMYAKASREEKGTTPILEFNHLASVIKVRVTNSTSESVAVSSVSFTAPEDIVGTYYIDYTTTPVTYTKSGNNYVVNTANLNVTDAEITAGASADFYLAIKPFTAKSGDKLSLAVNGQTKEIILENDVTFTAGHIKPLKFTYIEQEIIDYVTLPWTFSGGGSSLWSNEIGLSQSGLGSDYAATHSPYQSKFDTTGDYVQIKFDSPAKVVSFGVKMIGGSTTSYLSLQGSENGTSFTEIERFTISGAQNDILNFTSKNTINANYRYIRFVFTKGSNIGFGGVSITKDSSDPAITADNVTNLSAREGTYNLTYTITNPIEGTALEVSCDGTVVTEATASEGSISYSVAANSTTAAREGSITLTYGDVTKVVTVSQNAPVFKVSRTSVELEAAAGSSSTITVTSDFDWYSEASTDAGFTSDPTTCEWNAANPYTDGKTTVTISSPTENVSEAGPITLGILTFTNMETSDVLNVTVIQKTSYIAPSTGTTISTTISDYITAHEDITVSSGNTVGSIVKTLTLDSDIKIVASGTGNTGSFWGTAPNNDWRIYSKSGDSATVTISASNERVITSIKVTFSILNGGGLKYGTTSLKSGVAQSINSLSSVELTVPYATGKIGQARITAIEVTYE